MRIRLDRTVCDGFGICAVHAPATFSLDEWGYPSLSGRGDIEPAEREGVMRALLDCPAHAIVELDAPTTIPAGGEAGISRSGGPDSLWENPSTHRSALRETTSREYPSGGDSGENFPRQRS